MEDISTDRPPPTRPKRSRFQFSIRALFGLAVFVGLGCAALLNASQLWALLMFHATVAVLLIAILRGIFRDGSVRAFWLGFAVFGWVYVLLVLWPAEASFPLGLKWEDDGMSPLLTTKLSAWAYDELFPATPYPDHDSFLMVAHWLWAWLLAMLGGLLGRYFYATREGKS